MVVEITMEEIEEVGLALEAETIDLKAEEDQEEVIVEDILGILMLEEMDSKHRMDQASLHCLLILTVIVKETLEEETTLIGLVTNLLDFTSTATNSPSLPRLFKQSSCYVLVSKVSTEAVHSKDFEESLLKPYIK